MAAVLIGILFRVSLTLRPDQMADMGMINRGKEEQFQAAGSLISWVKMY